MPKPFLVLYVLDWYAEFAKQHARKRKQILVNQFIFYSYIIMYHKSRILID